MSKSLSISKIRTHNSLPLDPEVVKEWTAYFTHGRMPSPLAIFADCTYLGHDPVAAKRLEAYCLDRQCIPLIDYAPDLGWVFHTFYVMGQPTLSRKPIAERFRETKEESITERHLERDIANKLRSQGIKVRRQVRCAAGIADIVTPDAVYEVEYTLTRHKLFEAVGQVLIYRQAIKPSARAIVIGHFTNEVLALIPWAGQLGVEVHKWDK